MHADSNTLSLRWRSMRNSSPGFFLVNLASATAYSMLKWRARRVMSRAVTSISAYVQQYAGHFMQEYFTRTGIGKGLPFFISHAERRDSTRASPRACLIDHRARHTRCSKSACPGCGVEHCRRGTLTKELTMLHYALVFFVIALVAALFGFGGIAAGAAGIAKVLFFIFLVLFVVSLVAGGMRRGR